MDKYVIAPPSGSTNNSVGAADRKWEKGFFNELPGWQEHLAESTGYGIVSGCEPTISGLTVTVAAGVVHLAGGTRKEIPQTNITLDAADSTNPRIDLVYIDADGTVAKVTGTAAASPVVPTVPTGGISVSTVSVAANATTGDINDNRKAITYLRNIDFSTPEMYGAIGDGITDDTDAIQRALNNSKYVLFSKSTYLTRQLTVNSRTTLKGINNSKLIVDDTICLKLSGSFIEIDGLIFEGTKSRNDNTVAITDNGNRAASCSLRNLEFYQWTMGINLGTGYNDKVVIDTMYFNTVNNCISVSHGDGGAIKNIVAEPFINYVVSLGSCNGIEVSNILATGVGTDNGYITNPSVAFIVRSGSGSTKYDGINVHIHDVYCEKINTICISNTSYLLIDNVFCNNNYTLSDVFIICNSYGNTPKGSINLVNVECETYSGTGIWSPTSSFSKTVGNITITSNAGRPPVNVITSSLLSYNSISGFENPRFNCDAVRSFGKQMFIYPDFQNNLTTPPDKNNFSDGDIKFNPSFTANVNSFKNILGYIYSSLSGMANSGWSPIQVGLPSCGKYYLRNTLKGTFEGQLVYNNTDKTLAFWNGTNWCNLSFTILQ